MTRARLGALLASLLLAACVPGSAEVPCGELLCAAPKVCAPAANACVDQGQLDACLGVADGGPCTLAGVGAGICRADVCVVGGCGDGVVDAGEACDDGNAVDDDACSSRCALPSCGDGILQGAEGCDDGAANADDRACTTRCLAATCGDNLVQAGVEECDAGAANADDDACTTACARATCGDGLVFAGVEPCDDGNTSSADGCRADCRKLEACGDALLDAGEPCDDGNANPADGCDACVATTWTAAAIVGGNRGGALVALNDPRGVAVDAAGRVYVADANNHRIRRVDADGSITTVAGTSGYGSTVEGAPATSASLLQPRGVAVDGLGRLFIADTAQHRVRRVDLDGTIHTVAGTGDVGDAGDGGPATSARLRYPAAVTVDGLGVVYVADTDNHRVRRVGLDGVITTIAGTGTAGFLGEGTLAIAARLRAPAAIALDAAGRLLIADTLNHRVRRVDTAGQITTIAGTGTLGSDGDGGAATSAAVATPTGLAVDASGRILVASGDGNVVRRIDTLGQISTIAGGGAMLGDGGPAVGARLLGPRGLAIDAADQLVIADAVAQRVRRVDPAGVIATIAGTGEEGFQGDGGAAIGAYLSYPAQLALDDSGGLLIVDQNHHRVRRLAPDGTIATVIGNGARGADGYGGPALAAQLSFPTDVARGPDGRLYVADTDNCRVHRREADGTLTNLVGNGVPGFEGDGGPANAAKLDRPASVVVDAAGILYIADTRNHRVRRVGTDGVITTVVGTGAPGFGGDGGPAAAALLDHPQALAFDDAGRLVIADAGNHRLRRVDAAGTITTIAGTGVAGFSGDAGPATSAQLWSPFDVQPDGAGGLYVAELESHRLRHVDAAGTITTVAGTGEDGSSGDGGPALEARLNYPGGVAVLPDGGVAISDLGTGRVRRLGPDGVLTSIAGQISPEGVGPRAQARPATPRALARGDGFDLIATGVAGVVEVLRDGGGWLEAAIGRYPTTTATGDLARFQAEGFGEVGGVAWDAAAGRVYLTEVQTHRVLAVDVVDPADVATWTLATLVNVDALPGAGDGAAALARLRGPSGLHLDAATRTLYIADTGNHAVRALALDAGLVTTVAGTPATLGFFGDGGAATGALLHRPQAVTRCGDDLFIADTDNHRVRRVDAAGVITTIVGDGVATSSGEGAPASTFPVDAPLGLACDATGNLYVTSSSALRLLPADAAGVVDGTGPVQTIYGAPPRDAYPASVTTCLSDVDVRDAQTLHLLDGCAELLIELVRGPR